MSAASSLLSMDTFIGWSAKVVRDGRAGLIEDIASEQEHFIDLRDVLEHSIVTLKLMEGYKLIVPGSSLRDLRPPLQ